MQLYRVCLENYLMSWKCNGGLWETSACVSVGGGVIVLNKPTVISLIYSNKNYEIILL